MAKDFARTDRVADFLRKELASTIQFNMRDPRLGMVSITDVEVTRDLSFAKVFVTFVGPESDAEIKESVDVLNRASGFLRTQISKSHRMRTTPRLSFHFDKSVVRGSYLSDLIDRAVADDQSEDEE